MVSLYSSVPPTIPHNKLSLCFQHSRGLYPRVFPLYPPPPTLGDCRQEQVYEVLRALTMAGTPAPGRQPPP